MDDGGEKGQNITASTSAPSHKRVSFTPQIKVVNSDQGSGRRPDLDTNLKGIEHDLDKTSESSDSDSSSDDDDHFTPQLLPELEEQNDVPQSNADTELSFKIDKLDVSSECSSSSQHSDIIREPILPDNSTMVSPPIQVMERCWQGSDPDGLHSASSPSSTPKAPLGWSTTSNDSLFSIRIGNNSFCRDHATKMDVDISKSEGLHKSGHVFVSRELFQFGYSSELPKLEEPYHSGELYKESFKVSDVTIRGELVSCGEASSASKGGELMDPEETGMEYVPLKHTPDVLVGTSSKKSSASTPTVKGGTEAQTTTDPKKEKSLFCPLCYPGFCQGLCFCKITCNCCCVCAWPSCSGNCFSLKSCCCCCQSSASSWKSFTYPSCSRSCCCPGASWSCKCFTCSGCWPKGCCSGCPSLKCAWKCC